MLWTLLAAAASAAPHAGTEPPPMKPAVAEARATVTILSGARVKFESGSGSSDIPPVHDASIVTSGTRQPARLVEFE